MNGPEALFVRREGGYVATERTVGPWDPSAQSGGAVLALLGHAIEDVPASNPLTLSRLTVDLVRPAPVGPTIDIDAEVLHEDDRYQSLDLTVRAQGAVVTRARALRVRAASSPLELDTLATVAGRSLPSPEELRGLEDVPGVAPFLVLGAEMRRNDDPVDGAHLVWCRLRVPVVDGEEIRATSRAVLPFDLVNQIGAPLVRGAASSINADVSGHIARLPVGEWVALSGNTYYDHGVGHGVSMATMIDADGPFGVTSTSQILEPM